MRKKVYQLSRKSCYPCQILKDKFMKIEDKSFDYYYIDLDDLAPETIPYLIYEEARKARISSIPIVGVTKIENDQEVLEILTQLNHNYLGEFIGLLEESPEVEENE